VLDLTLENIKKIVENEINPILALHSGSCEVAEFDSETITAKIRLLGSCPGCPSSSITLYNGIVPILQEHFPELQIDLA
jgi:Fe-S cluster biogenesis protein NfuA